MPLLVDVFEGFLHHSIELTFRSHWHNEAVVDGQDRRVPFHELLDDVFTKLGIEAQLAQANNFFFGANRLYGCIFLIQLDTLFYVAG